MRGEEKTRSAATIETIRQVLEALVDAAIVLDEEGVVLAANQACDGLGGVAPAALHDRRFVELFAAGEERARIEHALERLRSTGACEPLQLRDESQPGRSQRILQWRGRRLELPGEGRQWLLTGTDVTRDHQSRVTVRHLLDSLPQSVFWKDRGGVYLGCNAVFARSIGLDAPEQIVGRTDFDLHWPRAEAEGYRADDREVMERGQEKRHIIEPVHRADGTRMWVDTTKVPLLDEGGFVYGVLGVYEDVTKRKQADEAMRQREREYAETCRMLQLVLDTIPVRIFWKDVHSVYLGCNQLNANDAGLENPSLVIGKTDLELFKEQAEIYRADDLLVMSTGRSKINYEEPLTAADGRRIWLRTTKVPLRDLDNRIIGILGTYEDITERREAEEERLRLLEREREARAAAEEAVKLRDDFLSVASHELKTPLTALQVALQLLATTRGNSGPPEVTARRLETAQRQVIRLTRLINHLLDVSRLQAGPLALEPEEMDLASTVHQVIALSAEIAHNAGSEIVADVPTAPVAGVWDRARLEQVVTNLVDNAIKYGCGRPIRVTLRERPDEVELVVADRGIGIAPAHHAIIFERYGRAASARHYGGMGLGLFITRCIVEAHAGRIEVQSQEGDGSRFIVTLPRRTPVPRPVSAPHPSHCF